MAFVSPKSNSEDYQNIIETNLLPVLYEICGSDAEFQQDNASIYVSKSSKNWFDAKGIKLIDWPARSPDLNPIENLWADLSRSVYRNGRQFNNVQHLKSALQDEWQNMDQIKIQKLITSMSDRLIEVIQKNGSHTHY